jgi:SAM-dependent methyltransferase
MGKANVDPTQRFSGLAELYARYRPDYPVAAVDYVVGRCCLNQGTLLVDVGCGTGISARLFAARGIQVIGVEPNSDMRRGAGSEAPPPGPPEPIYQGGTAEATGIEDRTANAVLAAQAFHWFNAARALNEFHRILVPEGWVVLMWNERDETDAATAAYGAVIRALPGAATVEIPRARAGEALLDCRVFETAERVLFGHEQSLNAEGLLGRAFSASYSPRGGEQAGRLCDALHGVFTRHQINGRMILRYVSSVYLARRPRL